MAEDQLPSPWSLGAPTGRDICQRESWQLYFLSHLGLFLIRSSCSLSCLLALSSRVCSRARPGVHPRVPSRPTIPVASGPHSLGHRSCLAPGFVHGSEKLRLPPSSSLFSISVTCGSGLCSGAPHDCTSQLSHSLEACCRAVFRPSRPSSGHLSHSLHSSAGTVRRSSLAVPGI